MNAPEQFFSGIAYCYQTKAAHHVRGSRCDATRGVVFFVQASSCYGLWSCCGNLYVKLVHLKSSFRVSWALKHACATSPVNYCVILKRHIPYRCCHDTEVVPVCGLQHILTVQTQPRHRPGDRYFVGGVSALGKPKRFSAWIISCVWLCTPST